LRLNFWNCLNLEMRMSCIKYRGLQAPKEGK
jgi:hypothetical protein